MHQTITGFLICHPTPGKPTSAWVRQVGEHPQHLITAWPADPRPEHHTGETDRRGKAQTETNVVQSKGNCCTQNAV